MKLFSLNEIIHNCRGNREKFFLFTLLGDILENLKILAHRAIRHLRVQSSALLVISLIGESKSTLTLREGKKRERNVAIIMRDLSHGAILITRTPGIVKVSEVAEVSRIMERVMRTPVRYCICITNGM